MFRVTPLDGIQGGTMHGTAPPEPPQHSTPEPERPSGRDRRDDLLAGLPIGFPGNTELIVFVAVLVLVAIIALASEVVNAATFVTTTTILTAAYLLSRGIAKASRVHEL
jgi:hypothetical protein